MFRYVALLLTIDLLASITPTTESSTANSWNDPTSSQYHIQTDEGPERYFRYQTTSGQYRKEKRLEDGTVIGTYAWIDDDGILRQRDYIADNAGYRILRTKNLYVGRNAPIAQAIKSAKKIPSSAGTLVKAPPPPSPSIQNSVPVDISRSPLPPLLSPPLPVSSVTPLVEISHNAIASTTPYTPVRDYVSSTVSSVQPGYSTTASPPVTSTPNLYLPASTVELNTARPFVDTPSPAQLPPIRGTSWYSSAPQYENNKSPQDYPYTFQNGPTYPIDKRGQVYTGNNNIGNGYDPQYPLYDGVSVTNDGFRYYIPRAYHEEQNLPGDKKSGSFGYIDPFGIRRVIYYNASPGQGFQHRKNNRYVGFDATPYDPRPY